MGLVMEYSWKLGVQAAHNKFSQMFIKESKHSQLVRSFLPFHSPFEAQNIRGRLVGKQGNKVA